MFTLNIDTHDYCGTALQLPTNPKEIPTKWDARKNLMVALYCPKCRIAVWVIFRDFVEALTIKLEARNK